MLTTSGKKISAPRILIPSSYPSCTGPPPSPSPVELIQIKTKEEPIKEKDKNPLNNVLLYIFSGLALVGSIVVMRKKSSKLM
jgi:hypothetical protein